MENLEFKKILFKTAFCVMACDGHIDDLEIEEMRKIDTNTSYFKNVDLSDVLSQLIEEVKTKGKIIVLELFQTLRTTKLTIVQELLIIEVAFRIINADNKVDENEIKFLNLLRSKLDVENETLRDRFGNIPYLSNMNYAKINLIDSQNNFIENIKLPDMISLTNIDLEETK
tara:strand:- start:1173 stop:1685 length:513 start_codon:yes stop_codon:yes gene_type:complete